VCSPFPRCLLRLIGYFCTAIVHSTLLSLSYSTAGARFALRRIQRCPPGTYNNLRIGQPLTDSSSNLAKAKNIVRPPTTPRFSTSSASRAQSRAHWLYVNIRYARADAAANIYSTTVPACSPQLPRRRSLSQAPQPRVHRKIRWGASWWIGRRCSTSQSRPKKMKSRSAAWQRPQRGATPRTRSICRRRPHRSRCRLRPCTNGRAGLGTALLGGSLAAAARGVVAVGGGCR
jgi:hypothetical protein